MEKPTNLAYVEDELIKLSRLRHIMLHDNVDGLMEAIRLSFGTVPQWLYAVSHRILKEYMLVDTDYKYSIRQAKALPQFSSDESVSSSTMIQFLNACLRSVELFLEDNPEARGLNSFSQWWDANGADKTLDALVKPVACVV